MTVFLNLIEGIRDAVDEGRGRASWRRVDKRRGHRTDRYAARDATNAAQQDASVRDAVDVKPKNPPKLRQKSR